MKCIRVTITEEYLLPDNWEIVTGPDTELACVREGDRHFMPDIEWLERHPLITSAGAAPVQSEEWVTVDDDRANWFIGHMEKSEVEIRDVE